MKKIVINNQQLIKNGFVERMLRMTDRILFRIFQVIALIFQVIALLVLLGVVCFVVYTGNLNVSNLAALIIIIWIMWEFFIG